MTIAALVRDLLSSLSAAPICSPIETLLLVSITVFNRLSSYRPGQCAAHSSRVMKGLQR